MASNGTQPGGNPDLGKAQLSSLSWIEPTIVVSTMIIALIANRRSNYPVVSQQFENATRSNTPSGSSRNSEDTLIGHEVCDYMSKSSDSLLLEPVSSQPRRHSSLPPAWSAGRFSNNVHSRMLQKFPFLIEMFYWALNYFAYRLSKIAAASFHGRKGNKVVQLAQDHGISILGFEHDSVFSFLFAIKEIDVQQFFLNDHVGLMGLINQFYSLVHIPGTVAFICWYYYAANSFEEFAIARRTMTLGNFVAFLVFAIYPCMPPRLLPKRFGFEDTVRQAHAESVWVGENGSSGGFNQLAAMPSLHFTYALVIGCTLFWHSGFLQQSFGVRRRERGFTRTIGFMLAGALYPLFVLLVIVATANHYYLDAVVAAFCVLTCFFCNRIWLILVPLERLFALILRVEKPVPTTGESRRRSCRCNGQVKEDKSCFA